MSRVTITLTDTPENVKAMACELRRFLLKSTFAFVWDNCGEGSRENPRRITVDFVDKPRWTDGNVRGRAT